MNAFTAHTTNETASGLVLIGEPRRVRFARVGRQFQRQQQQPSEARG